MYISDLAAGSLQNLGMVAIAAVIYDLVLTRCPGRRCRRVATALVFGIGVLGAMAFPVEIKPGLLFDLRSVFLVLAGPYGGWSAALVTTLAAGALRVWQGGAGALGGAIGVVLVAGAGLVFAYFAGRLTTTLPKLIYLGLLASLSLLGLFALPWSTALPVLQEMALPIILANFVGVVVAGEILNRQRRRYVRQRELFQEASTDALTGLMNRRAFDMQAPELAQRMANEGQPYAVLVVDIDHFKRVNDTYGHLIGDIVLRHVARLIVANVRDTDIVARYGGEEIAIVLPRHDMHSAFRIGNRIRKAVASVPLITNETSVNTTVSIGVHACGPHSSGDAEPFLTIFQMADTALYKAKSSGRNRVELAAAA